MDYSINSTIVRVRIAEIQERLYWCFLPKILHLGKSATSTSGAASYNSGCPAACGNRCCISWLPCDSTWWGGFITTHIHHKCVHSYQILSNWFKKHVRHFSVCWSVCFCCSLFLAVPVSLSSSVWQSAHLSFSLFLSLSRSLSISLSLSCSLSLSHCI